MKYLLWILIFKSSIGLAEVPQKFDPADSIFVEINIWICEGDTFYFDENPLTMPGIYMATFIASNGMDSVVTLWLDFIPAPVVVITEPFEICEGDSLELSGQYYSEEGSYIFTYYYLDSCSVEVPFELRWIDINTDIIQIGNTLWAQDVDPIYQWFDCITDLPIPGAIQSSFTPTVNGSYKVRLTTIEGCVEFSDCYDVSTVAINNIANDIDWSLYPNPVSNYLEIFIQDAAGNSDIMIFDVLGHLLIQQSFTPGDNKLKINVKELPPGTYMIKLNDLWSHSASKTFLKN